MRPIIMDSDRVWSTNGFIYTADHDTLQRFDHFPSMTKLAIMTEHLASYRYRNRELPEDLHLIINFVLELLAETGGSRNAAGVWYLEDTHNNLRREIVCFIFQRIAKVAIAYKSYEMLCLDFDELYLDHDYAAPFFVRQNTDDQPDTQVAPEKHLTEVKTPLASSDFACQIRYALTSVLRGVSLAVDPTACLLPDFLDLWRRSEGAAENCRRAVNVDDAWAQHQQDGLVLLVNIYIYLDRSDKMDTFRNRWKRWCEDLMLDQSIS